MSGAQHLPLQGAWEDDDKDDNDDDNVFFKSFFK